MLLVSIVACCRNESRTLDCFLRSLDRQQQKHFELEAVLADGASSDGTRERLARFAADRPWVRTTDNPRQIASTGLNAAIRLSRGDVIVRMDAHTEYADDYVARCLTALSEHQAAVVGGPVRMAGTGYWQRAIGQAYRSKFFSGGSRAYDIEYEGPVDSVPYGCWPRPVIESAGLLDECMVRNQDDELSLRIMRRGGTIWQSRTIRSFYHPRRSLVALARQFFGYGFWKVYTMRKHRTVVRARHIAPALAVGAGALLAGLGLFRRGAAQALVVATSAYAIADLLASFLLLRRGRQLKLLPALVLVFPAVHLAYGAGALWASVALPRTVPCQAPDFGQ